MFEYHCIASVPASYTSDDVAYLILAVIGYTLPDQHRPYTSVAAKILSSQCKAHSAHAHVIAQ